MKPVRRVKWRFSLCNGRRSRRSEPRPETGPTKSQPEGGAVVEARASSALADEPDTVVPRTRQYSGIWNGVGSRRGLRNPLAVLRPTSVAEGCFKTGRPLSISLSHSRQQGAMPAPVGEGPSTAQKDDRRHEGFQRDHAIPSFVLSAHLQSRYHLHTPLP